jgi:uncharacterized protein
MLTFEWDLGKAARNYERHGVTFDEAITTFADPLGRFLDDIGHSVTEERFVLLGRSSAGTVPAVMFTDRDGDRLRIISARRATRQERRAYEQEAR